MTTNANNEIARSVFCILHGLPRTVITALPLFVQRVVESNSEYAFTFVVHTQDMPDELHTFIKKTLHKPERRHVLKHFYDVTCDPSVVRSSSDAYYFRLYDSLRCEEEERATDANDFDIYMNCRLDAVPLADIPLNRFSDCFCIIGGEHIRPCAFHHRDWDYFTIGNARMYKLFHYLAINLCFLNWKGLNWSPLADSHNAQWGADGWATSMTGIGPDSVLSEDEYASLQRTTGLSSQQPFLAYSNIIRNLQSEVLHRGRFFVSDAHTKIFARLLRDAGYQPAFPK